MPSASSVRRPLLLRLRDFWLNVHLWLGAGLFVALCPLGLSGSALVWNQAFDQLTSPSHYLVGGQAILPPSAYVAAANVAFGDRATPAQVRLPAKAGDPVVVTGPVAGKAQRGQRPAQLSAWIEPVTGRVLDVGNPRATPQGWMHNLHGNLLVPGGVGRKIVGWLGWTMTASCLTGLWLWWPRRLSGGLAWRRTGSTLNNLHHQLGFWIFLPLLVLALSGVYIAFPQTSRALFGVETPRAGAPGGGGRPLAAPHLGVDEAAQAALIKAPDARIAAITLPTSGKRAAWRVQVAPRGEGRPTTFLIDDGTGEARLAPAQPGADPLSRLVRTIHDSHEAPIWWQAIVFLAGLAPTVLGLSGIIVWLKRPRRRRLLSPLPA